MEISPSRTAAFEILQRIESENSFSAILLPHYEEDLTRRDASLCHNLTLGVLRRKLYLDRVICEFTKKDIEKFDVEVLNALRIGLFQLIFLDKIPSYSAINESVNLVKLAKKHSAAGLVNAVLRRAANAVPEIEFEDDLEKLWVMSSHPKWLIERWVNQFGFEQTRSLAESNNVVSEISFRLTKRFHDSPVETQDRFFRLINDRSSDILRSGFVEGSYSIKSMTESIQALAGEGLIYFQDPASQMVAGSIELNGGQRFLDLCASPGGKSSLIAARTVNENTLLVSGDLYSHRIRRLKENFRVQGVNSGNIVQYNAEFSLPFESQSFDTILVDAPCSGTGTIRHNPEIRYSLNAEDIDRLSRKQLTLLINASYLIKPGGRLVYSTCSLEEEENERVIAEFLSADESFTKVRPKVSGRYSTADGFCRTYPQIDHTDGFFMAVMRRTA